MKGHFLPRKSKFVCLKYFHAVRLPVPKRVGHRFRILKFPGWTKKNGLQP